MIFNDRNSDETDRQGGQYKGCDEGDTREHLGWFFSMVEQLEPTNHEAFCDAWL